MLRIRAYVTASGVSFAESISNAGMHDSFGTMQLSGKPGGRLKRCKASVQEPEARGQGSICFFC